MERAKERLAVEMKRESAASGHETRAGGEAQLLEEIERLRAEVRELRQKIEQR